jgi:hypothetical protein
MTREFTIRVRARWLRTALIVGLVLAVLVPAAVVASDRFGDVPDSNTFHDDINALADNGVTLGCDPAGTLYCPSDPVTRQQMAGFMNRLGALSEDKEPVVRAKVAGTASQAVRSELVQLSGTSSGTADSIATLDGLPAGAYIVTASWNTTAHGSPAAARIVCDLSVGSTSTRAIAEIDNDAVGQESMAAVVAGDLGDGETVNLSCWRENATGQQSISQTHVVAYPVVAVESSNVSG